MSENTLQTGKRQLWVRGFFMLLMIMIFQLAGTVVFFISVFQFVMMLFAGEPNARLVEFGHNLARFMQQIINFLTFAAEEVPFPFSDWPAENA